MNQQYYQIKHNELLLFAAVTTIQLKMDTTSAKNVMGLKRLGIVVNAMFLSVIFQDTIRKHVCGGFIIHFSCQRLVNRKRTETSVLLEGQVAMPQAEERKIVVL
jgi:hypothetical protein